MTRIFYPYPLILFLFSSPFLRALIANPSLILIPSRVLPTVGRFALFGPSLPLPFVSALFVFTCALEGQPPLLTASAAPSHWLRDACAMLPLYSLYSHTHSLSSRALSKSRTATLVPQFSQDGPVRAQQSSEGSRRCLVGQARCAGERTSGDNRKRFGPSGAVQRRGSTEDDEMLQKARVGMGPFVRSKAAKAPRSGVGLAAQNKTGERTDNACGARVSTCCAQACATGVGTHHLAAGATHCRDSARAPLYARRGRPTAAGAGCVEL
jgi:hypothetical protein